MTKKKSPDYKFITYVLSLSAAAAFIFTAVTYFRPATPVQIAEINSGGSASLYLSPSTISDAPNSPWNVDLMVDTATTKLAAVHFEISYDPSKVEISDVTMGAWITQKIVNPVVENGRITGTLGAAPDPNTTGGGAELNRTGTGKLISFQVKPLVYGTHYLAFDDAVTEVLPINSDGQIVNQLKSTSGLTFSAKPVSDIVGSDHRVDLYDFTALLAQFGGPGTADFNGINGVDLYDFTVLVSEWGIVW